MKSVKKKFEDWKNELTQREKKLEEREQELRLKEKNLSQTYYDSFEILGGIKDEKDKDITQKVIQERELLDNSGTRHSVLEILLSKIQEANQQQSKN